METFSFKNYLLGETCEVNRLSEFLSERRTEFFSDYWVFFYTYKTFNILINGLIFAIKKIMPISAYKPTNTSLESIPYVLELNIFIAITDYTNSTFF